MDSMYLDNIAEALEEQIVSYRWLSLHLKVTSNTAKQMLYEYFTKNKSESTILNATYLISGIFYDKTLDTDMHKVCVVKECNLDMMKTQMKSIYSIHIYSLQKCELKDFNLIQASNYQKLKENFEESMKYSPIILQSLKYRPKLDVPISIKENIQPKEKLKKEDLSIATSSTKHQKDNEENIQPKEKLKKEVNGIVNKSAKQTTLFNKKISSMFVSHNITNESIKNVVPAKKVQKAKGKNALSAFLFKKEPGDKNLKTEINHKKDTKPLVISSNEEIIQKEDIKPVINEEAIERNSIKELCLENTTVESVSCSKVKKKDTPVVRQKAKTHTKRKSKLEATSQAKRRRILQLDSSDSSNDEGSNNNSDQEGAPDVPRFESPTSPSKIDSDDEVLPATPQEQSTVSFCGKKKVRKLVDKTFTDEDGFLVTKKEYLCVTDDSEDESVLPTKKSKLSNGAGKISPNKKSITKKVSPKKNSPVKNVSERSKSKQASIMSFFKKK